ncbi:zinc ABC transporter substrate-binding protein [Falsirhodobacter deserti]|uniref:zinc ABC transporter substrate-binding protein n=1 Tax=Falsirhodobacter deserti TaxID=1365611 RepID=UPI000FE2DB39|nr:zinc ABC transporter substrate-binding protein [Falsirhodobacter deserti]
MRYSISLLMASLATPAIADVTVVTDIAPVQSLVAQVMGETPEVILPPGSDPHRFQLRPSQARAVQNADLAIWLGPEMTPWLETTMEGRSGEALELLHVDGLHAREYGDDHAEHAHGHDEHEHEHEHEHDDHGHDGHHHHDGLDPHAWLDPANAMLWLDVIATRLSEVDPANAETYAANAAAAKQDIDALDGAIAQQLAPVADKPFVVFHDAYGYFTDHYGLTLAGSISAGDASSPSAARLAGIRQDAGPATCVFPEEQHDPKLAEQMASDAGVRLGGALAPEGAGLEAGPQLYAQLMQGLADTLTECLDR